MGCWSDLGWSWNVKPAAEIVGKAKARVPSAEFVESFVIFLYGVTNVFLEHLSGWGGEWTARDLEHVSISVLFFGGGLVRSGLLWNVFYTFGPLLTEDFFFFNFLLSVVCFSSPNESRTGSTASSCIILLSLQPMDTLIRPGTFPVHKMCRSTRCLPW